MQAIGEERPDAYICFILMQTNRKRWLGRGKLFNLRARMRLRHYARAHYVPLVFWGDMGREIRFDEVKIAPAPRQEQGVVDIVKDRIAAGILSK